MEIINSHVLEMTQISIQARTLANEKTDEYDEVTQN